MKPFVHYVVGEKNPHHGRAIVKGFKARGRNARGGRLESGAVHLIGGLQHGSLELLAQARAEGQPYVFIDRAYFGGGPGTDRLRVVPNAYQHWWPPRSMADGGWRMADGVPPILPWRADGDDVLVIPPSAAIEQLFGVQGWLQRTLERLKRCTQRRVVVSFKGDAAPLSHRLAGKWCVVTWTSNVAVEAACAGIPVFCHTESAAAPVGNWLADLENRIERPRMPDGREQWAAALAAGQFTVREIAEGKAAAAVLPHFSDE